ncbi:hypothetical protein K8R30_03420 [archaeon]|nr:hypothetical protein [archaeon]
MSYTDFSAEYNKGKKRKFFEGSTHPIKSHNDFLKLVKKDSKKYIRWIDRGKMDRVTSSLKSAIKLTDKAIKMERGDNRNQKYKVKWDCYGGDADKNLLYAAAIIRTAKKIGGEDGKELGELAKKLYVQVKMPELGEKRIREIPRKKVKRSKFSNLLKKIFLFAAAGTSLIFLSPNITGNTIANLSMNISDAIGLALIIFSAIFGFLLVRKN